MTASISLKGCFPPIPTPFDAQDRVDHDKLALNLERWQRTPLAGFVVLGSNGEAVLLREEEKLDIWKTSRAAIGADRLFIAGTGCEATRETIELTEKAASTGADAVMVVTPHYYKARMDHAALVAHYIAVADRSPIPLILYNVPAFTGVDLMPETIIELADHPAIIGLKESSGNVVKMGQVIQRARDGFQVLAGSGSFLLPALSVGAVGGVMALAAIAAEQLAGIVAHFDAGERERARTLQLGMIPANAAVTTRFGIAGLKAACDVVGLYGGPVRPPLRSLSEQQWGELREILRQAGII